MPVCELSTSILNKRKEKEKQYLVLIVARQRKYKCQHHIKSDQIETKHDRDPLHVLADLQLQSSRAGKQFTPVIFVRAERRLWCHHFTVNNKPNAKHPWFRRASRLLNHVQNFTKFMAIFYSVIFFFFSFETPHLSFVKPAKGLQELKLE